MPTVTIEIPQPEWARVAASFARRLPKGPVPAGQTPSWREYVPITEATQEQVTQLLKNYITDVVEHHEKEVAERQGRESVRRIVL